MADAASRAGHVQAAAGAAIFSSWRRHPLAHPHAAHASLARQAERPPLPTPAAQGMVMRRRIVMAGSNLSVSRGQGGSSNTGTGICGGREQSPLAEAQVARGGAS
eukprot:scaffold7199_cov112-Isochrysis_galbana.AAC.1